MFRFASRHPLHERKLSPGASVQVAKPAWLLRFVVLRESSSFSSSSSSSSASLFPLPSSPVVFHKVNPSANRTSNNHKVVALCRNRIPWRPRGRPSGIKVVGSLIVPKDMTLQNHSTATIMYGQSVNWHTRAKPLDWRPRNSRGHRWTRRIGDKRVVEERQDHSIGNADDSLKQYIRIFENLEME